MPSVCAASNSGRVAGLGISRSKKLSISASSSIHQRGKKVVSASSGKTTMSQPRALASRISSSSRDTTCWRNSLRAIGPNLGAGDSDKAFHGAPLV